MNLITVQVGDVNVAQNALFHAGPIGSGVVACIYDTSRKMGGICSSLFINPQQQTPIDKTKMGLFLSLTIPVLIEQLVANGCEKKNMVVKLCGGSNIIEPPPLLNWTENFPAQIENLFQENEIMPAGFDLGGTKSRLIEFNTETGQLLIKSGSQEITL